MNFNRFFEVRETDNRLVYVLKSLIGRFISHNISQTGGQLAYFFLLSAFPLAIFLNALIGSFYISEAEIVDALSPFLPQETLSLINTYIQYITQNQHVSLLSIGLFVTLFSASRAIRSLIFAINKAYDVEKTRGFFGDFFLSVILTVGIGVTLILSLLLLTVGKNLMIWISGKFDFLLIPLAILDNLRWVIVLLDLFVVLAFMYYFVPNRKMKWRNVIPGTVFSVVGWILLTLGFSYYINHFGRYSLIYGSLGAVIVLMLWLYFVGILLVLGGELNDIIEKLKFHYVPVKIERNQKKQR